ncbi:MAG: vWA domain-containing protein [Candidatus Alcyoniella australis]|nr:vWA domain-containing protein [Candidatus Alcyoniella australis]
MNNPDQTPQPAFEQSWEEFYELISGIGAFIPPAFWEILKAARVIFTPGNAVSDALRPSFGALIEGRQHERERDVVPVFVPVFDYHSPEPVYKRIKGVEQLDKVNPTDMALLDMNELIIKAQDRELYVRVMDPKQSRVRRDEIKPVRTSRDKQRLNPAAQKLYLLMDISYSMRERSRLIYAKALLLEYLRSKRNGDSWIFFRAFDFRVYEQVSARRREDYNRLINAVLFAETRGKGTDIRAALLKAIEDIRRGGMYLDAEIVLVTDGIDRFDIREIKSALGGTIKLHTFKIGCDSQEPVASELKQMMEEDGTLSDLDSAARKFQLNLRNDFADISKTFVELPDLRRSFYRLDAEAYDFIRKSVQRLSTMNSASLDTEQRFELYCRASFLADFVRFVLGEGGGAQGERLSELERSLQMLEQLLEALLGDKQLLLRVAQSGNRSLIGNKRFRERAHTEGLRLEQERDPIYDDRKLRLALGLKRRAGKQQKRRLWEVLMILLRQIAGAFKSRRR